MEKEALITLKSKDMMQKYKVKLHEEDHFYRYNEQTEKETLVEFDTEKNILKREDQELSMEYLFIEGKTTIGKVYIKSLKKYIDVIIKTDKITKTDKSVNIKYDVEDNLYEYNIDME